MKKTLLLAAFGFVFLTGFGRCYDRSPEGRIKNMDRMAHHVVDDVMDEVDATDPQRAQVQKAADRVVNQVKPLIEQHPATRAELWAQWQSKQPDKTRVHAIVDDRVDALRGVLHGVADAILEVHSILTPEQRNLLTEEWKHD